MTVNNPFVDKEVSVDTSYEVMKIHVLLDFMPDMYDPYCILIVKIVL